MAISAQTTSTAWPEWIACPGCKTSLKATADGAGCSSCHREFRRSENGYLDLLLDPSDRFPDVPQRERDLKEENSNTYSMTNYTLPMIRRLLGDPKESAALGKPIRVLSCACGVGIDVDLFNGAGFEAYGVDCGERMWIWSKRTHRDRLYVANIKSLPVLDNSFDFLNVGCVLPHIGVLEDSTQVIPEYREHRLRAALELARVVRPGGYIFMNNPNQRCPIDFHHMQPHFERLMRFHWPNERFLMSINDFRDLFQKNANCSRVEALPPKNYWGILQKRHDPVRRFLVLPMEIYIEMLSSRIFKPFLTSGLNPWLFVLVQK